MIIDLAFEVDLLSDETTAVKAGKLFYLSREALKRRQLDELWKAKAATSPKSIGKALLSDSVLDSLRKELRRATGLNVEPKELSRILRGEVLRPECGA